MRRDGTTEFDPDFGFKGKRDGTTEFDPDFGFKGKRDGTTEFWFCILGKLVDSNLGCNVRGDGTVESDLNS